MPAQTESSIGKAYGKRSFSNTHWSVVLSVNHCNSEVARAALGQICRTYWYPLYAYVRRSGCSVEDAEDLTQMFFERLLENNSIGAVSPERGKFRSFLLASLKNFLINEWQKARAQKRGGPHKLVSLEGTFEARYFREPADLMTPEELYHRRWALTILENVMSGLREEYAEAGQVEQFDALKPAIAGGAIPYEAVARQFNASQGAIRVWVHRLRKRYREALRSEVAQTVESPREIEGELRFLFSAIE